MGILGKLFNLEEEQKEFVPDLKDTEYNNWLKFLESGGTSDEWDNLKKENKWRFKSEKAVNKEKHEVEVRPVFDAYYALLTDIEDLWKKMNKTKDYNGKVAKKIEKLCFQDIELYKQMYAIDKKYGQDVILNPPAFTRLAMLYERQGKYADAINVCEDASTVAVDLSGRVEKLKKKI